MKRFTEWEVGEIRRKYWDRVANQEELAGQYGVNQSYISRIISEKIYVKAKRARMAALEREVEKAFVARVAQLGGVAEKFTSPGRRAVPDRIVLLPGGEMLFVELKAPGRKPTRSQQADHDRRRALGYRVEVIDSIEAAKTFTP